MNNFQSAVILLAVVDALLMLLFPPYYNNPLSHYAPKGFDGFYFYFSAQSGKQVHTELLSIELLFLAANMLAAWLALNPSPRRRGRPFRGGEIAAGTLAFAVVDFAIVGLFPPFEPYQSLVRVPPVGFDGFHFLFGDKMHRPLYQPLLAMECYLLAANLLGAWLLLNVVRRRLSAEDRELLELAHHLPPEKLIAIEEAMRQEAEAAEAVEAVETAAAAAQAPAAAEAALERIGRHGDRRHGQNPGFPGPERRHGERRKHPR
ncbi:MAG TPA: hypothetical protein VMB75_01300 [Rhodocyclaceae bacterium]|nr:hypothetical protein [Rhodocyclaceae bacterium]